MTILNKKLNSIKDKSQDPSVLNEQLESIPIIILIEDSKMVKSNMPQHDIIKDKSFKTP